MQVPHPVQRIRRRRVLVSHRRWQGHKQAEFTSAVKRSSHRAGPAPCTVCPALTGVCVPEAVARSPPRAPSVCRQKCGGRQRPSFDSQLCPEHAGGKLRYTVLLHPQCESVLSDPLTQADSVPACAGPSCQRKGFLEKGSDAAASAGFCRGMPLFYSVFWQRITVFQRPGGFCGQSTACIHTPDFPRFAKLSRAPLRAPVCRGEP